MAIQFFGNFLVDKEVITPRQLREATDHMTWLNRRLGDLAKKAGYMTAADVERVQRAQATSDQLFGDLALDLGVLSREQLDEILQQQRERHVRLGESLIELGHLGEERLHELLAEFEAGQPGSGDPLREIPAEIGAYSVVRFALARLPRLTSTLANLTTKIGPATSWEGGADLPITAMLCADEGPGIEIGLACDEAFAQTLLDRTNDKRSQDAPAPPLDDVIAEFLNILSGNARSQVDTSEGADRDEVGASALESSLGLSVPQVGAIPDFGVAFEFVASPPGRGYLVFAPLR